MRPRLKSNSQSQSKIAFEFLHTELDTGKLFAKIALKSKSEKKIARNRFRARLAYDTALRFRKRIPLTRFESQDIHKRLRDLKADLHRLGEVF